MGEKRISLIYSFVYMFVLVNCIYPLGLESGYIPDEALSHSVDTSWIFSNPSYIRLNRVPGTFPNGWQAAMGKIDYLQVKWHAGPGLISPENT